MTTDLQPTLEREVSLPMLVLYGLGTTVGAGIYALTGEVAGEAGMRAPLAFLLSAGWPVRRRWPFVRADRTVAQGGR
ncbi:MAG: hypothetical protein R2710_16060 [Acidimicrobiales bacterium]